MTISRRARLLIFATTAGIMALAAPRVQAQPAAPQEQPRPQGQTPDQTPAQTELRVQTRGQAQTAPLNQTVTPGSLAGALQNAERTQNADDLLVLYGQAVTTPELARAAIGQLLSDYYGLRGQAQTADQATQAVSEAMLRFMVLQTAQNQIIVQQNQQLLQQQARIIELLEAQNKRNAPTVPARR